MKWASTLSRRATLPEALDEVVTAIRAQLGGQIPDLVFVFSTMHHGLAWEEIPVRLRRAFPGARLLGCSGGGVLAAGEEREDDVALTVTAAVLPDVLLSPFRLSREVVVGREDPSPEAVRRAVGLEPGLATSFVLLTEPYSCNSQGLLRTFDALWPHAAKIGGIASGATAAGMHALFLDDEVLRDGAVGVSLYGAVELEAVVAPGCRPVGRPLRVTGCKGSLVLEVDGLPALPELEAAMEALDARDRRLWQSAPMVGLALLDRETPRRGELLVRHVVGVDPKRQGFAVGHPMQEGDVLHLLVRDALTAATDLTEAVSRSVHLQGAPEGVLLFSCLGRGHRFYGAPDVDSRTLHEILGPVPVGGFFANGEFGPVHGRTWLHGYAAALGLFRTPAAAGWN